MKIHPALLAAMLPLLPAVTLLAQSDTEDLSRLTPGRTKAENALWIENDLSVRFNSSKRVVVADLKGPAEITMIHFAMPATLKLDRDLLLRMYWDGESSPSVDAPLVDFFCDPAGLHDSVNTILVNKRRGFNAYFPMPFRRSAKIELVYDGTVEPGEQLWKIMPCYSYVMYRTEKKMAGDTGYFHASWRQEGLLLGKRDYVALEAKGRGKFVGWNVTVRQPGRGGYPWTKTKNSTSTAKPTPRSNSRAWKIPLASVGAFPKARTSFPRTGYFPFINGAAAYRFFLQDAISFEKSLKVAIGFGVNESPFFRKEFSKPGSTLQLSTTVYWYQTEPHAALPPMPPAADRAPAPEQPLWPDKETLPSLGELKSRGVKLRLHCGRPEKEIIYAEKGYGAATKEGFAWSGWGLPVYHSRAGNQEVAIELAVPKNSAGLVRVFIIDPDEFEGGRKETLSIAGNELGSFANFQEGKWIEQPVTSEQTAQGKVLVKADNAREGSNAVISIIEWVGNAAVN